MTPKPSTPDRDPLLTIAEVADRLRLSAYTVAEMARQKRLPSVQIGRNRRFRQSEIDRYIERSSA